MTAARVPMAALLVVAGLALRASGVPTCAPDATNRECNYPHYTLEGTTTVEVPAGFSALAFVVYETSASFTASTTIRFDVTGNCGTFDVNFSQYCDSSCDTLWPESNTIGNYPGLTDGFTIDPRIDNGSNRCGCNGRDKSADGYEETYMFQMLPHTSSACVANITAYEFHKCTSDANGSINSDTDLCECAPTAVGEECHDNAPQYTTPCCSFAAVPEGTYARNGVYPLSLSSDPIYISEPVSESEPFQIILNGTFEDPSQVPFDESNCMGYVDLKMLLDCGSCSLADVDTDLGRLTRIESSGPIRGLLFDYCEENGDLAWRWDECGCAEPDAIPERVYFRVEPRGLPCEGIQMTVNRNHTSKNAHEGFNLETGECECFAPWYGTSCQINGTIGCFNGGYKTGPNTPCTCPDPTFFGDACERSCRGPHVVEYADGLCSCEPGYAGDLCFHDDEYPQTEGPCCNQPIYRDDELPGLPFVETVCPFADCDYRLRMDEHDVYLYVETEVTGQEVLEYRLFATDINTCSPSFRLYQAQIRLLVDCGGCPDASIMATNYTDEVFMPLGISGFTLPLYYDPVEPLGDCGCDDLTNNPQRVLARLMGEGRSCSFGFGIQQIGPVCYNDGTYNRTAGVCECTGSFTPESNCRGTGAEPLPFGSALDVTANAGQVWVMQTEINLYTFGMRYTFSQDESVTDDDSIDCEMRVTYDVFCNFEPACSITFVSPALPTRDLPYELELNVDDLVIAGNELDNTCVCPNRGVPATVQVAAAMASSDLSAFCPFVVEVEAVGACPNDCSGRGTCDPQELTCICEAGFEGFDCSQAVRDPVVVVNLESRAQTATAGRAVTFAIGLSETNIEAAITVTQVDGFPRLDNAINTVTTVFAGFVPPTPNITFVAGPQYHQLVLPAGSNHGAEFVASATTTLDSPKVTLTLDKADLGALSGNAPLYITIVGEHDYDATYVDDDETPRYRLKVTLDDELGPLLAIVFLALTLVFYLAVGLCCVRAARRRKETPTEPIEEPIEMLDRGERAESAEDTGKAAEPVESARGPSELEDAEPQDDDQKEEGEREDSAGVEDKADVADASGDKEQEQEAEQEPEADPEPVEYTPLNFRRRRPLVKLIPVLIVALVLSLVRMVFDVALLHATIESVANLPERAKITDAFDEWVAVIGDIHDAIASFFKGVNIIESSDAIEWNCGGAVSMISPVVLFFGCALIFYVLQRDVLYTVNLGMGKAQSKILSPAVLNVLQVAVILLSQVMLRVFNISESCSDLDYSIGQLGRVLSVVFVIVFFYAAVLAFAGVSDMAGMGIGYRLTFGWIFGVVRLGFLTIGVWLPTNLEVFEIVQKASMFASKNPNNIDNRQEDVIRIVASSRGLIWLPLPFGSIMTKLAEASNDPAYWIWDGHDSSVKGLFLQTPARKRRNKYAIKMVKLGAEIALVFYGTPMTALVAMAASALEALEIAWS